MKSFFDRVELEEGSHGDKTDGVCLMELVSVLAKEEFSDAPETASPLLSSIMVMLNDGFADAERQLLKPYAPQLIGTSDDYDLDDPKRKLIAQRWLIDDYLMALISACEKDKIVDNERALRDAKNVLKTAKGKFPLPDKFVKLLAVAISADVDERIEPAARRLATVTGYSVIFDNCVVKPANGYLHELYEVVLVALSRLITIGSLTDFLTGRRKSLFGLLDRLIAVGKKTDAEIKHRV